MDESGIRHGGGSLIVTLYVQSMNSASIRQAGADPEPFWQEMEFAQWFLIRTLCEFYDPLPLLPEVLAALYMDRGFVERYIADHPAAAGRPDAMMSEYRKYQEAAGILPSPGDLETPETAKAREAALNGIYSGILQSPLTLDPEPAKESSKYIRARFPECRIEYKGFGRFLGYSDLNRFVFWSPFLLLRHFHLRYRGYGEEIAAILTALSRAAGLSYARREITADNPRELAASGIRALSKRYARS